MRNLYTFRVYLFLLICAAGLISCSSIRPFVPIASIMPSPNNVFSGEAAYQHVIMQTNMGPRSTGSKEGWKTGDYIIEQLKQSGWQVEEQAFEYKGVKARNIIGRQGKGPVMIIGTHYDTRRQADQDTDLFKRTQPVIGANDGASGVAVLLELARTLDTTRAGREIWMTFFDAEDNEGLDGWEWLVGSTYMAQNLTVIPIEMILLDMVGDADQQLFWDYNSDSRLNKSIWKVASDLGYAQVFIPQYRWSIIDDHIPFIHRGIPSTVLIDFDYPYWHTTHDTIDKISTHSLEHTGLTIKTWLEQTPPNE
jgi:glutaminyl-peptide cyclotransferase